MVWCLYPEENLGSPPFAESEDPQQQFWACRHLSTGQAAGVVQRKVREERGKTSGRMIVVGKSFISMQFSNTDGKASGDSKFTDSMRTAAVTNQRQLVEFTETEYRPPASKIR